jgi:hypothetical protein
MRRPRLRQTEIDFLCLAVFGMRALPDDMAVRIVCAREGAEGIAAAFLRHPELRGVDAGEGSPESLEAVVA